MTKEELANIKTILPMPFAGSENLDECGIATNESYAQDYMTDKLGYMSLFYNFRPYEIPYVAPADDPENPPLAKELFSRQYLNALIKYFTSSQFYEQAGGITNPNRKTLPYWSDATFPYRVDWFGNPQNWAKDAIVPVVYEGTLYFIRSKRDYNDTYWGSLTLSEILAGTSDWQACLEVNSPPIPYIIDYSNSNAILMAEFDNEFKLDVSDNRQWKKMTSGQFPEDGNVIVESNSVVPVTGTNDDSVGEVQVMIVISSYSDIISNDIFPVPLPAWPRYTPIQLFQINYDPYTDGMLRMTNFIPVQKDYYWCMWRRSNNFIGSNNPIIYDGKIRIKFTPNRNA